MEKHRQTNVTSGPSINHTVELIALEQNFDVIMYCVGSAPSHNTDR